MGLEAVVATAQRHVGRGLQPLQTVSPRPSEGARRARRARDCAPWGESCALNVAEGVRHSAAAGGVGVSDGADGQAARALRGTVHASNLNSVAGFLGTVARHCGARRCAPADMRRSLTAGPRCAGRSRSSSSRSRAKRGRGGSKTRPSSGASAVTPISPSSCASTTAGIAGMFSAGECRLPCVTPAAPYRQMRNCCIRSARCRWLMRGFAVG